MKVNYFLAALVAASVAFSSCSKDDDKKPNNSGSATDAKFKATIDNAAWASKGSGASYGEVDDESIISVFSMNSNGSMYIIAPDSVGTFNSVDFPLVNGSVTEGEMLSGKVWHSNPLGAAVVTITKLDRAGKKVSGTFSFTAKASGGGATGNKVVTSGSFTDVPIED